MTMRSNSTELALDGRAAVFGGVRDLGPRPVRPLVELLHGVVTALGPSVGGPPHVSPCPRPETAAEPRRPRGSWP